MKKRIIAAVSIIAFSAAVAFTSIQAEARKAYIEPMEGNPFEEPCKIRCTCYCEHGKTATGVKTRYGIAAAAGSSDFKATLNPNPNWKAENQFIESIEKDKANLTQEELDRRVEDFVLEYGLFGFKTAERLKVVLKEVQQNET